MMMMMMMMMMAVLLPSINSFWLSLLFVYEEVKSKKVLYFLDVTFSAVDFVVLLFLRHLQCRQSIFFLTDKFQGFFDDENPSLKGLKIDFAFVLRGLIDCFESRNNKNCTINS